MNPMERIFERCRAYLTVSLADSPTTSSGARFKEEFVWDHSVRVWELTRRICAQEEISLGEDELALASAALFHDAGWIAKMRNNQIPPTELLSRPGDLALRRLSADVLRSQTADILTWPVPEASHRPAGRWPMPTILRNSGWSELPGRCAADLSWENPSDNWLMPGSVNRNITIGRHE